MQLSPTFGQEQGRFAENIRQVVIIFRFGDEDMFMGFFLSPHE
jgi:hypothetical protein